MTSPASTTDRAARPRRPWRWPAAVAAMVLVAAIAGLALLNPTSGEPLAPDNPAPDGARALARVLAERGVDVRTRGTFDQVRSDVESAGRPVTVLVARPGLLTGGRTADLGRLVAAGRADLVLVGADNNTLTDLDLPVGARPVGGPRVLEPRCADPVAGRAGPARLGGTGYTRTGSGGSEVGGPPVAEVRSCYPVDGAAGYLALDHPDGRRSTLLGDGAPLTNERFADAGDAALALGVLGRRSVLIWWTPDPLDGAVSGRRPSLTELVPPGVRFAALQLVVVVIVLALWRGRRLGRLVTEPLPVVVRAIETTRGRAQLYRRARARGRAAQVLRAATTRRLALRCGLPRTAAPGAVALAAAGATGRPAQDVLGLLVGHEPPDDPTLVTLALDLQALEEEVRRS
jgi:Domain of unknown function (DUF4350)